MNELPETDYLKVPADRVGALIGTKGETKQLIENATNTHLDIDSDECTVAIYPNENMEDPLGVWKANHIVKAIARGFNPRVALKLNKDDTYLEIIKLPLYVGKSKKDMARYKGRIIGKDGKTREIIVDMAEVDMAIYGKLMVIHMMDIGEIISLMDGEYINQIMVHVMMGSGLMIYNTDSE